MATDDASVPRLGLPVARRYRTRGPKRTDGGAEPARRSRCPRATVGEVEATAVGNPATAVDMSTTTVGIRRRSAIRRPPSTSARTVWRGDDRWSLGAPAASRSRFGCNGPSWWASPSASRLRHMTCASTGSLGSSAGSSSSARRGSCQSAPAPPGERLLRDLDLPHAPPRHVRAAPGAGIPWDRVNACQVAPAWLRRWSSRRGRPRVRSPRRSRSRRQRR